MASTSHIQSYPTPFKRHLAFFDRDNDGILHYGDTLKSALSIGLDFPAAVVFSAGIQVWYGNKGNVFLGPLRAIEISKVTDERTMLEDLPQAFKFKEGLARKDLMSTVANKSFIDQFHVFGIWALTADREGIVSQSDIELCQKGTIYPELQRRRQYSDNALPFVRGGPISVSGHAWFVKQLFGVNVYQYSGKSKGQ